jgi:hypothetical protein
MDSTLIAVQMIVVGYGIFRLGIEKPKVCLMDYVVVGPSLLAGFVLLFWHYEYSFFACIGAHLWIVGMSIKGDLMRRAEARQAT